MAQTLPSHDPALPRGVLGAVGALVLITVAAVAAVRLHPPERQQLVAKVQKQGSKEQDIKVSPPEAAFPT